MSKNEKINANELVERIVQESDIIIKKINEKIREYLSDINGEVSLKDISYLYLLRNKALIIRENVLTVGMDPSIVFLTEMLIAIDKVRQDHKTLFLKKEEDDGDTIIVFSTFERYAYILEYLQLNDQYLLKLTTKPSETEEASKTFYIELDNELSDDGISEIIKDLDITFKLKPNMPILDFVSFLFEEKFAIPKEKIQVLD